MIGGNLDEDDADAVGVLDPHFGQSPGFRCGRSEDTSSCRSQPVALGVNIAYLEPDHHRAPGRAGRVAGDLEQPRAEEEHQPWIRGRAELPVDRQAQYVAIETMAAAHVGGAQQNPAAQNVHAPILAVPVAADISAAARRRVEARPGQDPRRRMARARQHPGPRSSCSMTVPALVVMPCAAGMGIFSRRPTAGPRPAVRTILAALQALKIPFGAGSGMQ